jgi:hypothetical protein
MHAVWYWHITAMRLDKNHRSHGTIHRIMEFIRDDIGGSKQGCCSTWAEHIKLHLLSVSLIRSLVLEHGVMIPAWKSGEKRYIPAQEL